jgi:hypothetical protein
MQAGHRPEQRGLAASGRSEHANQLALAHIEGNAFKGVDDAGARAVVLGRVDDADLDRRLLLFLEIHQPTSTWLYYPTTDLALVGDGFADVS